MTYQKAEGGASGPFVGVGVRDEEGFWEGEFAGFEGGDLDVGLLLLSLG